MKLNKYFSKLIMRPVKSLYDCYLNVYILPLKECNCFLECILNEYNRLQSHVLRWSIKGQWKNKADVCEYNRISLWFLHHLEEAVFGRKNQSQNFSCHLQFVPSLSFIGWLVKISSWNQDNRKHCLDVFASKEVFADITNFLGAHVYYVTNML